jgi:hypothetical protein
MNKAGFLQNRQGIEKLCHENLDKLCAQALELILFDKFVEVRRKQLENEAQMAPMDE